MNDPELNLNSPSDLAGQVAALQRQVFTLLLALIVVSGTLVAYLGYESHHLGKDITVINTQVVQPYKQKLPAIEGFVSQLVAYGKAHPDFSPILVKYALVPPPATNAPAKPAPAAPAALKK
jgi:hypothetical protein